MYTPFQLTNERGRERYDIKMDIGVLEEKLLFCVPFVNFA